MDIYEMKREIGKARHTLEAANTVVTLIAPLLVGRLRHCDDGDLIGTGTFLNRGKILLLD